jgi:hypothetical protein
MIYSDKKLDVVRCFQLVLIFFEGTTMNYFCFFYRNIFVYSQSLGDRFWVSEEALELVAVLEMGFVQVNW